MKKILIVHTKYRHQGGEDIAVENEVKFLKENFEIETIYFENYIKSIFDLLSFFTTSNIFSNKILNKKIEDFNPDFVYFHNLWFKGSLGLIRITTKKDIPTIVKLHNYRFDCTKSYLTKNHLPDIENCKGCGLRKSEVGKFNKYFKDSYIKSLLVNRFGVNLFNLLKNQKIKIIVLTEFQKNFLLEQGFNTEEIFVQRNVLVNDGLKVDQYNSRSDYIVYAGRISEEKGVEELILNFIKYRKGDLILKIIGEGPELDNLKKKYKSNFIEFLGWVSNDKSIEIIKDSRALLTFTKLYEGQPTVICEASLLGVPSIFPRNEGIMELFPLDYELTFNKSNKNDLEKVFSILYNPKFLDSISKKVNVFIKKTLNKEEQVSKFNDLLNS